MAVSYNISAPQGAIYVVPFQVTVLTNPSLPFNESTNPRIPLDLSSAEIQGQVRPSYNSSSAVLTMTEANGMFVRTDATGGLFELRLTPDSTIDIRINGPVANFYYDIEAKFSADNIVRMVGGRFILSKEITRIA